MTKAVEKILQLDEKANEATIRGRICEWLSENNIAHVPEHRTAVGPVDIHLQNRRIIIETKRSNKLKDGPYTKSGGSRKDETPLCQLARYVDSEKKQFLLMPDGSEQIPYYGVITDGRRWWIYAWPPIGMNHTTIWDDRTIDKKSMNDLLDIICRKMDVKEWVPANPGVLFKEALKKLENAYEKLKDLNSTTIQKDLWMVQLKSSGNHPDSKHENELFIKHTMLTLISRIVSISGGGPLPKTLDTESPLLEGYVSWVVKAPDVIHEIKKIVGRYDWTSQRSDIMKELYHDMVSKEHRHIYGEYYTPDWLAEMVCYEVIDDDYIRSQIEKFDAGEELDKILDPACGSGTFLYHAGRRVLESMPMIESHMELDKKKKFIRKLICGIDIHPVAVEMAFANMNRLLNTSSNTEIQIYQGDSLLSSHIQAKNKITSYQTIGDHEYLHLTTPKQKDLIIPATFTKNNSNVKRFVLSAYDSNPFPNSLTRGLSEDEIAVLKESYDKLIKIIYDEGNGIWSWYIRNQAAPLLLLNGKKMGRIVTNPPWVRNSTIQDKARTKQLIEMGQIHKLYVGGKDSTHFNLASLFVVRTRKLYLDENSKSGWVLPQVALTGTGQWEKLRENLESTKQIDLTNLAFPTHSKSCVIVTDEFNTKMVLQKNENFDANESWVDSVQNKTKLVKVLNNFKNEKSSWFKGNRTLAGQGSTMVPSVLVIIDQIKMEKNDQALIKTKKSKHKPWKKFGMQEGIIPKSWIKNFKFSNNIAAFHSPTSRQIILPMNKKGQWDKARLKNDYWRDASAIYEKNVGTGASTPHTLEERLDFNRRLSSQFEDNPLQLIYNRSGNRIYAFVALPNTMIDASAYRVPCKSKKEAYFLSGILNSDILQPRLRATRESDRDFHTLFWYKIPIPRYDSKNSTHIRLAELALQAEKIAKTSYTEGQSQQKMRLASLRAVEDAGIMSDLDACVKKILPDHV